MHEIFIRNAIPTNVEVVVSDIIDNVIKNGDDALEGCELVEGSVMVGNNLAQYEVESRRVSVRLWNTDDVVRFCVVPTVDGTFEPTASVSFSTYWRDIVQPLGSVNFTAEALSSAGFRFRGSDGQHAEGKAEGQEKGNKFLHGVPPSFPLYIIGACKY